MVPILVTVQFCKTYAKGLALGLLFASGTLVVLYCPRANCDERLLNSDYQNEPFVQQSLLAKHDDWSQSTVESYGAKYRYGNAEAARKMMQFALKGAWINYREYAIAYFSREEDTGEWNEYSNNRETDADDVKANIAYFSDSMNYRLKLSKSKLVFKVEYNF